jgi:hypothetical protein
MTEQPSRPWTFAPSYQREGSRVLVRLWREALDAAIHPPTCFCQGLTASYPPPENVEANILDYLRAGYLEREQIGLVALIDERRRRKPFAGFQVPFETWLQQVFERPLSDAERKTLVDDLAAMFRSYAETRTEQRFECVPT